MIERRMRMNGWFGAEEVPALRFEVKDVPEGEEVRLKVVTEVAFRGLELEVDEGDEVFLIRSIRVDGVEQLDVEFVPAYIVDKGPLSFPFTKPGGEIEMTLFNENGKPEYFRAFILGRVRTQAEERETVQP